SMNSCSLCHAPTADVAGLAFSSVAGGVLCASCTARQTGARVLPGAARACIAAWSTGALAETLGPLEVRAHQRLLREFLQEHLLDGRPLRAFSVWEHGGWSAA
ncbi:MAG: DNA repair protein RecO C-terminal domain-containing protein, partial [Gemmatimonadaceae bacterium]